MSTPPRRRVAVVYQHLPHYREPVFRLMSETPDIEYHFLADPRGESGIRTVPAGHLPRTHDLTNHWVGPFLIQRGLLSSLRSIRPDAVIFLGDYRYLTTWVTAALQRTLGTRVYFWTQGWRRAETGVKSIVRKRFYRLADHLFVYGDRSRRLGISAGFSPECITAIGNSETSEADLNALSRKQTKAPELRIGAVMRLSPNKKATQLAEIAALLNHRGLATQVHIAGEGVESDALESACAAAGVTLRQYGQIHSASSLSTFYANLDVCVIPGAAGLSVLQALSYGRPVVTNDELNTQGPEVEALIPGVTGTLVPEDDIEAFTEAIVAWAGRLQPDSESAARACIEGVRNEWVADRQAELINEHVRGELTSKYKVAIINPNASTGRYSGPNIFMDRLFDDNDSVSPTVVTGNANAAVAFPWAEIAVPTAYSRSGRLSQVKWMIALTAWLWSNSSRFDIIHAHGIYLFNLIPLAAAQLRGVPVAVLPLGTNAELGFTHDHNRFQPFVRLRKRIISHAALGMGLSHHTQRELSAAGLPPHRVRAIGNPVDSNAFCPPSPDSRYQLKTVGFVGALSANKSPEVLLRAISIARTIRGLEDIRALFIGPFYEEKFEEELNQLIEELNLVDNVEMTGYTPSVANLFQRMSLFALPSKQEGLPGAMVEAMASGLPCVVTDVGAMGDVVRASNAGHVTARDPRELASAIAHILGDEQTWRNLSNNARTHAVATYSVPAVQLEYQRHLEFALEKDLNG